MAESESVDLSLSGDVSFFVFIQMKTFKISYIYKQIQSELIKILLI